MPISQANNSRIKLTRRLAAAASAVREACRVVDVGCDHGKLAAHLIDSGKCSYAYATDISELSLKKAAGLFASLGIEDRTEAIISDGLGGIDSRYVDDIVIAGLGFDVIARILAHTPWLKNDEKRLILVPSSHHERLRRFLYEGGFEIREERAVKDMGHTYTVIVACYCGTEQAVTPVFAAFGKVLDSDGDKDDYIEMVKRKNKMLLEEMENAKLRDIVKVRNARDILKFIDEISNQR